MEETNTGENKKSRKKILLLIFIGLLLIFLILISGSYAFYRLNKTESSTTTKGNIMLDCMDIEYEEVGQINLTNAYPVTDDYALNNITPVKIRIINKCENNLNNINYALVLTTLTNGDNNITSDKIRINSKRGIGTTTLDNFLIPNYLDSLSELTNEYSKSALEADILARKNEAGSNLFEGYRIVDTRVIDENFIATNSENVYEVQLWIDYYEGDKDVYSGNDHDSSYDNSTKNKTFVGALSVVVNPYENFSEPPKSAIDILREKDTGDYLSTSLVGDMYRYQGLYTDDIRNYICLGDNCCKEESCAADSNDDMYRIIGMTPSGEMKVIKKTALTDSIKWWSDSETDIKWPQSLIYQKLNGISEGSTDPNLEDPDSYYYSLDDNLKSLIVTNHSWLYGDTTSGDSYNGDAIYGIESVWSDTIEAPIGLMYLSDYLYAYKTNEEDTGNPGSEDNAVNTWIHLSHNETTHPGGSIGWEWLMTRYGLNQAGSRCIPWVVGDYGHVFNSDMDYKYALRPIFYLTSTEKLCGEGTFADPFLINCDYATEIEEERVN